MAQFPSFPEEPCPCQRQGKEISASFGIPSFLGKAPKCLWCSQNVREHQRGRRGGPQTRAPRCGKGWLTRLTSIKHLTHHRTAESHPSHHPPQPAFPTCSQRGDVSQHLLVLGKQRAEERTTPGHGHMPAGCPLPLFMDPRRSFRADRVMIIITRTPFTECFVCSGHT